LGKMRHTWENIDVGRRMENHKNLTVLGIKARPEVSR